LCNPPLRWVFCWPPLPHPPSEANEPTAVRYEKGTRRRGTSFMRMVGLSICRGAKKVPPFIVVFTVAESEYPYPSVTYPELMFRLVKLHLAPKGAPTRQAKRRAPRQPTAPPSNRTTSAYSVSFSNASAARACGCKLAPARFFGSEHRPKAGPALLRVQFRQIRSEGTKA
jgi:hypothetical protein